MVTGGVIRNNMVIGSAETQKYGRSVRTKNVGIALEQKIW
jgi:hypothetical protein